MVTEYKPIVNSINKNVSIDEKHKQYVITGIEGPWKQEGKIGAKEAYLNGKKIKLSGKAFISDGQLMLPALSLAEILGGKVILEGSVLQFWIEQ